MRGNQQPEKMTGKSLDISEQRRNELKQLFPAVFTETTGKDGQPVETIDFERLKAELGTFSDIYVGRRERYGMEWPGKRDCMKLIQEPSRATLKPCREESVDFDTTQNLFIEGDNLEVLKLLQKSYYGKVKMIYIDPPYNTGKEFIYPDNYTESLETYLAYAGLIDDEGKKFSTNTTAEGRFHTKWLNMMYPRLYLAKNLLRDDGVIFISIGEQELHNLRILMNEVFGEENFIGCAGRISKKANNQGDYWAPNFDYALTYSKQREFCVPFFGGVNYSSYNLIEENGNRKGEKYQLIRLYMTSLDSMRGCNSQRYFIECPDGSFVIPPGETFPEKIEDGSFIAPKSGKDKVWRWSYKSYLENKDKIVVKNVRSSNLVNEKGETTYWNVFTKTYLQDVIDNSTATPNNFIEGHINQRSSHELKSLGIPFDFAKPSSLISFLSEVCRVESGDIVLDFFAGSASSAHAVMSKNSEDNKNRKYICVQLPEICDEDSDAYKAGYRTIADIGKERIRRVAKKLIQEQNGQLNLKGEHNPDLGFKVLKLDKSNFKQWLSFPEGLDVGQLSEQLVLHTDHIDHEASQEDILYELLLKAGFMPTEKIETLTLTGKHVFSIAEDALLICLEEELTSELIDAVADREPMQFICLDKGFKGNDQLKANAVQTFKSRSRSAETEMVFKVV